MQHFSCHQSVRHNNWSFGLSAPTLPKTYRNEVISGTI
jgi:hypothetical protein